VVQRDGVFAMISTGFAFIVGKGTFRRVSCEIPLETVFV
jgi:hypothetical protein